MNRVTIEIVDEPDGTFRMDVQFPGYAPDMSSAAHRLALKLATLVAEEVAEEEAARGSSTVATKILRRTK